jgi:cellulose synthase/poly-beta-1,6-N-acetylglucosamine synthase-like glycosyltransferase
MIELAFWLSVAWIIYAYAGYALLLAVCGTFRSKPVRRSEIRPKLSVIVTVHNPGVQLREKLENLLAQEYPADMFEILVADDASDDGADRMVHEVFERRGVRLIRLQERGGKEKAQKVAIGAANGDILVFTDITTLLQPDGLSKLSRSFADPTVGGVSSIDRISRPEGGTSGEDLYVRYEMSLRRLESRVGSLVGMSGNLFAVRKEVCADFSSRMQSDFRTALVAVRLGYRCVTDEEVVGSYPDVLSTGSEFTRKIRTVIRGLTVLANESRMLNPFRYGIFAWQLFSHKVARWTVPYAMLLALLCSALAAEYSSLFRIVLALQILGYGYAAVSKWMPGGLLGQLGRAVTYLVQVNAATLIAWIRFVRGDRIVMWTPSDR